MLLLLIIVALLAGCTGGRQHAPQLADIEKTLELYQDRDDAEGLTALVDSLEAGGALTSVQLGYWRGAVSLMRRDYAEAMRWFRKALEGDVRWGIERHSLNQLLNDHAGGLSLPAYLNSVRLDAAYDLLHNQPDESIADIAAAVGFTPQNLRLQFKKRYGLTPAEYRQSR